MTTNLFILTLFFIIVSCNPKQILQKEIERLGYISMTTPMEKSGTGTLIAGTPNAFSIIAPPEECFPKEIDGRKTGFRFHDKTTIPTKIKNISGSGKIKFDLLNIASLGGAPIGAGADFETVHTVGLEMKGISIEYMNAPRITEFYTNGMSEMCKIYLDFSGFIFQAIKVEQLIYTFYESRGEKIELDTGVLEELVEIGFDIDYEVENHTELVINTPTYLGYQLGSLRYQDHGLSLYRSSNTTRNNWRWKSLDLFKNL